MRIADFCNVWGGGGSEGKMERSAGYGGLKVIPGLRARRAGWEAGGNGVPWGLLMFVVFGVEAGVKAN